MTERTYSTTPQNATPTQPAFQAVATNLTTDALPHTESVDEEPYTIKCICDYTDDDGNTILCERCNTWQHIECFYHGKVEEAARDDFTHFCADCKPRQLDRRQATERQRQQREDKPPRDPGEKKTKRPPSKSHKKKPKLSDVQVNGFNYDHDGAGHSIKAASPHEQSTHAKKAKGHRSQHSISSQATKRSPSHTSRPQNHAHPLSPANTPPDLPDAFRIHSYSKQLRDLYDNDPGHQQLRVNTFAQLTVGNTISQWLRDPEKLRSDTGISNHRDVFNIVKAGFGLDGQIQPELEVIDEPVANDPSFHLRSLIVKQPVREKDLLIGELNGTVGFQSDYTNEEPERYRQLCHPSPFVFFHPRLPLYIDTRREGSQCRYIRRSCRANVTLDTYITNQTEYHFCVSNERPLAAREKVTLAWDFRFPSATKARYLHFLGLSDEDGPEQPGILENEYLELTDLIDNVLSDYGGCACGLGANCAFARFHRNYLGKSQAQTNGSRPKKGRKPKQHISPNSTGHATNSRDASEGQQDMYDGEDDARSTSGSTRSKPHSRDVTPVVNGITDAAAELITEREKRKLANIEKTFEKMDQEQPPRKKKRTSDGPLNTPNTTKSKQKATTSSMPSSAPLINGTNGHYRDVGTSRQHSGSPITTQSPNVAPYSRQPSRQNSMPALSRQPSVAPRSNYSNASVQTEEVGNTWYSGPSLTKSRKKILSLNMRLLRTQHHSRVERETRRAERMAYQTTGMDTQTTCHVSSPDTREDVVRTFGPHSHTAHDGMERPKSGDSATTSIEGISNMNDVTMNDAPASSTSKPPPPSWPGVLAPLASSMSSNEQRTSPLSVQMPPIPTFSNNSHASTTTPGSVTPSSSVGSLAQSPFGSNFNPPFSSSVLNSVGQHASPVKKKLSLKDYKAIRASASSKNSNDPNTTPTIPSSSTSIIEESNKLPGVMEGSIILDSPVTEKASDPIAASDEVLQDTSSAQASV